MCASPIFDTFLCPCLMIYSIPTLCRQTLIVEIKFLKRCLHLPLCIIEIPAHGVGCVIHSFLKKKFRCSITIQLTDRKMNNKHRFSFNLQKNLELWKMFKLVPFRHLKEKLQLRLRLVKIAFLSLTYNEHLSWNYVFDTLMEPAIWFVDTFLKVLFSDIKILEHIVLSPSNFDKKEPFPLLISCL